jgi:hypothetical protein
VSPTRAPTSTSSPTPLATPPPTVDTCNGLTKKQCLSAVGKAKSCIFDTAKTLCAYVAPKAPTSKPTRKPTPKPTPKLGKRPLRL